MSRKETTGEELHRQQLSVLRDNFLAARDRRGATEAATHLTDFATAGCFDCGSILTAMETAYAGVLQGGPQREAAVGILSGMEDYFRAAQISHKALFPPGVPESQAVELTMTTISRIHQETARIRSAGWNKSSGFGRTLPQIPVLTEFVNLVNQHLHLVQQFPGKYPHPLIQTVADEKAKRAANPQAFDRITDTYGRFVSEMSTLMNQESTSPADLQAAAFQLLFNQASLVRHPSLPHPAARRFGAGETLISLREIANIPLNQPDLLGRKLLHFLTQLPRGDVFWDQVRLLFTLPAVLPPRGRSYTPEQTKFIQRIFVFQRWLSEKLILPAIADLPLSAPVPADTAKALAPDPVFDRLFAKFISSLRSSGFELGYTLYQQAAFAASSRQRFTPGMSLAEAAAESRLLAFIQHLAHSQASSRMMVNNREVHTLLGKSWQKLRLDWEKRFAHLLPHKRKFAQLMRGLESQVKRSLDRELSQSIVKYIEHEMGGNFRQLLSQHGTQVHEVTGRILGELARIDYWPHPDLVHTIVFSRQSVPELMGISQVSFVVDEGFDRPIGFHFRLHRADFGISGELRPDNRFVWLFDETVLPQPMRTILEFLVVASLRDYLKRGEIIARHPAAKRAPSSGHLSNQIRTESLRPLPRRPAGPRETEAVHQAEITALIETHSPDRGQFTPRQVGAYRRSYTHADDYVRALLAYEDAPPPEKTARAEALAAARQKLRQPLAEKVRAGNLPARLTLEPLIHPRTGEQLRDTLPARRGQPMFRNTFVNGHIRPALTRDELASYALRYERRYAASSALHFADCELLPWMVGLYHEQFDPPAPGL